jgi:hypothetical protein
VFPFLVDCVSDGLPAHPGLEQLKSDQANAPVSAVCSECFGGKLVREVKLCGGLPSVWSADVQEYVEPWRLRSVLLLIRAPVRAGISMGNEFIGLSGTGNDAVRLHSPIFPYCGQTKGEANLDSMSCSFPYLFFLYGKRLRGKSRFASNATV